MSTYEEAIIPDLYSNIENAGLNSFENHGKYINININII